MKTQHHDCPAGHGPMELIELEKIVSFRGVELTCNVVQYVCGKCGLEVATVEQAGATQRMLADAYRKNQGLMTSNEIKAKRKSLNMTQKDLADAMSVGIASVKRWEGGTIQTRGMDKLLRQTFWPVERETALTGNRPFSLKRIKLVLMSFNELCSCCLIQDEDRLLYSGKLLWYADMVAYRELGRSMTGATYAALPMGPQLNNYSDLATLIFQSDETRAEPLTQEERRITKRVFKVFPGKTDAYHASHRELIWKNKKAGEIIPYLDAFHLTEM